MRAAPLRALAIDIDGTLIDGSKKVPRFTREEIHRVVDEYGVEVLLVTARGPRSARVIGDQLGLPVSLAAFGGAYVAATAEDGTDRVISAVPIETAAVRRLIDLLPHHDVSIGVHTDHACHVTDLDYWALREARNTAVWPTLAAMDELPTEDVFKVMFRGEAELLVAMEAEIRAAGDPLYVHRTNNVLEIISDAQVKLPAVGLLAEHFGFGLDQIVAFGDTAADLGMLQGVGVGVLMGNADPALDTAGTLIRTLSNNEDGIGIALRLLFPTEAPFLP